MRRSGFFSAEERGGAGEHGLFIRDCGGVWFADNGNGKSGFLRCVPV